MSFAARRQTLSTWIGLVPVGSGFPIVVQSMTNTDTADADATADQVLALAAAGSQIVRVTVNNEAAAAAVPDIVRRVRAAGAPTPIVGDFHYNGHLLLARYTECAKALDKYRINPGNVGGKRRDDNFRTIVRIAAEHEKPVRIGVNWGSLDQDLLTQMMDDNARAPQPRDAKDVYIEAMIASALRSARLAEEVGLGSHKKGVTDPVARAQLQAELDGLVAHLYGLTEEEFAYILTTFPLVAQPVKDAALDAFRTLAPKPGDPEISLLIATG